MELVVLVPVLGRPQNAATLAESLSQNTVTEHRLLWICSPGDKKEIAACKRTYGEVMIVPWEPGRADFARKINYAFEHTTEPWLFQAADDLRFSPKWDIHALRIAKARGFGVVGTADLGNPLVLRGMHSTHTLFSRTYIETFGGTMDNTGTVFSELYDHQYCDNEFVQTARARGQWGFAKNAVVEHLHPHWGKSEMDATYDKALRETAKDRNLFAARMRSVINSRESRLEQRARKRETVRRVRRAR